jgi:hypothetical protein
MGIGAVAGGGTPGDRGVACEEGLGGVGTKDWRDGAWTTRGGAWGSEGWWSRSGRGTLTVGVD